MKNIFGLISLFLLFLLGGKTMNTTSLSVERGESVCVIPQEEEASMERIAVSTSLLSDSPTAFVDTESLARQFRVIGRNQRQLSQTSSVLSKWMVNYRMAKSRLDALLQSSNHVYTSLPLPSWAVSSDHYVFGMRRILI